MQWISQFDLFLLDFDGLLVDTEQLHFAAYQALCQKYGLALPWTFSHYCTVAHAGRDLATALYAEFPQLHGKDWNQLYAEKKGFYLELLGQGKMALMPGVEPFLRQLAQKKVKRCVVTNSWEAQVALIRRALPILETIPLWITRERAMKPKPAPDGYLKAIELLADPGDRIVGFEDTVWGIQALQAAGAIPILISSNPFEGAPLQGVRRFESFNVVHFDEE